MAISPLHQSQANCLLLHDSSQESHWIWHVSTEAQFANLESTDSYFSGDGTEDWISRHDLDGTMYGATLSGSPPVLGNMFRVFFTHRQGDLDGGFNTREVMPFPEGPYPGSVSFDRDEFALGIDIQILNAVYGRIAYSSHEMTGDWKYSDSPDEPQEYEFEALEVGVGFRQDFESAFDPRLTFGVDAYLAVQFFDYEHTEIDGGASADTSGTGFKGMLEANAKYLVADHAWAVLGVGYAYQNNDEDDLDLTNDGFLVRIGLDLAF